jgi:hypothetical protein
MRTHSRVYTFRTRETQTGPGALSTPGTAVSTGRRGVRGRRLPPLSGRSLPPRRYNPARDVKVTRHQQGFPGSRPSGLSPRLWPLWLGQRPLGSSVSFAPSRSGTGHARHGGDRSNTTRSYVPGISQTSSTSSLTACDLVSQHPPFPGRPAPGNQPGSGRTQEHARSPQPQTSSRHTASADPVRGSSVVTAPVRGRPRKSRRCTPTVLAAPTPVRYASVDTATQRPAALQGDTPRDRAETARMAENSQLAGRFRSVWQVMGSNHRRLSRRFYSTLLLPESPPADQRIRRSRHVCGPPPSAMRPWVPGFGVRAGHGRARTSPRTGAEKATDGGGKGHGRGRKRPRTGPVGAVTLTVHPALCL